MAVDLEVVDDQLPIHPKMVDTHQDYPAIIDYRLVLVFFAIAVILFRM